MNKKQQLHGPEATGYLVRVSKETRPRHDLVIRTEVVCMGLRFPWPTRDYRKVLVNVSCLCSGPGLLSIQGSAKWCQGEKHFHGRCYYLVEASSSR